MSVFIVLVNRFFARSLYIILSLSLKITAIYVYYYCWVEALYIFFSCLKGWNLPSKRQLTISSREYSYFRALNVVFDEFTTSNVTFSQSFSVRHELVCVDQLTLQTEPPPSYLFIHLRVEMSFLIS